MAGKNKKDHYKYPGKRVTTNGNQLVCRAETLMAEAGVFYPITPSTEMGEMFQLAYAKGQLNAFGQPLLAVEAEGEHAAQGGAIAYSVTGKRVVNFTSGQGVVYGIEQYYHAPGKLSTMVVELGARALTKHALNVHCGHDDLYAALDTGWNITFAKDAQQAVDQAIILRKVNELALNPGINGQDGFLTTHLERTFLDPEAGLIREFLGSPDDIIECPTEGQKALFGPKRRRVPAMIDLTNPILLGPVQNQEHYMNGIAARRNNFSESILPFYETAAREFGELTGRHYGLISQYNCEKADTIFVVLGSAAENIEAVSDYLRETRDVELGVIHVNILRPFPENAIIKALRGKKNVIVLERTDEPLSGENPLTRDVRVALSKAMSNFKDGIYKDLEKMDPAEMPKIVSGVYGLGSRDFRPEGIIGAYDFVHGKIARKDGLKVSDGVSFFYVGINHPYAVQSEEKPSCLPEQSIAIRFHSIGGWGMITTGKNLGSILGEISAYKARRDGLLEESGELKEIIHISANPKYGSEKKGSPTNYFLVAAKDRVRVNCDLQHVNVVLCCDPKIFLHTNPLQGLEAGGAFVWESNETSSEKAWQRIPQKYRKEIIDKKIRVYLLSGFEIAKKATDREDLQTRMQGNSFLGSFFKVSSVLKDYGLEGEEFLKIVKAQYEKKFGRLGEKVVESNMEVMRQGYDSVKALKYGDIDARDTSAFVGALISPCSALPPITRSNGNGEKAPMFKMKTFDDEYRSGYGYDQPASPLASVGVMAAASGMTSSKYVARRQIPIFLSENCTQCMDCMVACPDSAMPSTSQDISAVLNNAVRNYVSDETAKKALLEKVPEVEAGCRAKMLEVTADRENNTRFADIVIEEFRKVQGGEITAEAVDQLARILIILPLAFKNTKAIFGSMEKKEPGSGGLFSIFINDLCKGCAACVDACGKHEALVMADETEEMHAEYESATVFMKRLRDTPEKYLGLLNTSSPQESKAAALKMHLMIQSKYDAFVSGDGACAGCGEKSILRSIATLTETLMKPIFETKASRIYEKAAEVEKKGAKALSDLKKRDQESYQIFRKTLLHLVLGYGYESSEETERLIEQDFKGDDQDIIKGLVATLRHDAEKHIHSHTIEELAPNGMAVMAMAAHTGCNTVYGSTPPNNPHPYPWMNSLFQDGATIGWLIGESFIKDHAKLSVLPERLADLILDNLNAKPGTGGPVFTEDDYFMYTHFTDTLMTNDEVMELPKVWVVGGDGGMGDIGFQNVSKAILQNRPNINMVMLDTQVYSNTGGQNSDSSPMTGGFDMNQAGKASEGKLTEKKSVAECFLAGHGSPFIAQVSAANVGTLYKAILDGLCYRGTSFFQSFTTCQPEHGVPDYAAQTQALRIRDSRGMPEFVYDPQLGESYQESLNIKGNTAFDRDWVTKVTSETKKRYTYTVAHWAFTEARFRFHHRIVKEDNIKGLVNLEDQIQLMTMNDVVNRRYLDPNHRAYVADFGTYAVDFDDQGEPVYHVLSRQMVLFCVERRKAWRLMQSRAGIENKDYVLQKELLAKIDSGELSVQDFLDKKHLVEES